MGGAFMKVFGIDPGTLQLGWGMIEIDDSKKLLRVEHGCLVAPAKLDFITRIGILGEGLQELMRQFSPDVAVIEKIFLGKNVDSAFKLGHVRGICAVECQRQGARVFEYAARTVKKQITGSGSAEKTLVRNFLYRQLNINSAEDKGLDATDALALAFCHILQDSVNNKLKNLERI